MRHKFLCSFPTRPRFVWLAIGHLIGRLDRVNRYSSLSDLDLVSQVQLGKKDAFQFLVERYQGRIVGFCRHMLGDSCCVEDAAQDVFVKAWQSLGDFRPVASFSAWVFRIARNHCIDILRSSRSSRMQSIDDMSDELPPSLQSNGEGYLAVEARDQLAKFLLLMSPRAKEVILLREMYGFSYEELAKMLDCSVDAVKSRLKRARQEVLDRVSHFSSAEAVLLIKGAK